ncbi:MAG TPA: hypothetical protein VGO48_08665 [Conexibacter sp.]|jgi:hypothetical protein|nr:hypothetical protein [Conexibacter sp.]
MRKGLVVGLLAAALAVAVASSASADFGFEPGSVQVTSLEAGGQPETQAGAHPDTLNISFAFTRTPEGELEANARNFAVDLPAGYNGDPTATPRCTRAQIVLAICPPETEIGVGTIQLGGEEGIVVPVYNVVPQPGVTAEFAMFLILFPVRLVATLRDRDFGVHVAISDILQELPLAAAQITLWGVPADHQTGTSIERRALLTLPTRCGVPLRTDVSVRTWEQPNVPVTADVPPTGPLTGCAALDLSPTATVATDATTPDTPTGLHVDVDVPQHLGPSDLATAAPSRAIVTLPAGLELAPALAQGTAACGDAQFALGSGAAPACPAASRIGTVEIDAPQADPLRGGVYVATSAPGDALRLFLTAQGPDHTAKLVGALRRDADSGRLVATVEDLPQLPLSHIALDFQGGPGAPFVTPLACGPQTASVVLASWAGRVSAPATSTIAFGGPDGASCPASPPSAPKAAAGVSPSTAGASSTPAARSRLAGRVSRLGGTARKPGLRLSLRRSGGANLRSLAFALPRVLRLDGGAAAQACGRDQAREDRCPAAARVGSASLSTPLEPGPMSAPVYLVASGRRGGLPSLRTSLAGDGVRVVLEGAIGVRHDGQVTSTFANLPDMPLTAFELRLRGGARGLLTVDAERCRLPRAQRTSARVAVRSQGGASASQALATGPWRRCVQQR